MEEQPELGFHNYSPESFDSEGLAVIPLSVNDTVVLGNHASTYSGTPSLQVTPKSLTIAGYDHIRPGSKTNQRIGHTVDQKRWNWNAYFSTAPDTEADGKLMCAYQVRVLHVIDTQSNQDGKRYSETQNDDGANWDEMATLAEQVLFFHTDISEDRLIAHRNHFYDDRFIVLSDETHDLNAPSAARSGGYRYSISKSFDLAEVKWDYSAEVVGDTSHRMYNTHNLLFTIFVLPFQIPSDDLKCHIWTFAVDSEVRFYDN